MASESSTKNASPELPDARQDDVSKKGSGLLVEAQSDASGTPENPPSHDLREVIQESKQRLADEAQVGVKKRGRPRKHESQPRGNDGAKPISSPATAQPSQSFVPVFCLAAKLPFGIWSDNTGIADLKLSDEQAKSIAEPADALAQKYFPQMSEKGGLWVALFFAVGLVSYEKITIFQEHKKNEIKEPSFQEADEFNKKNLPKEEPSISASDYFPQMTQ